MQIEGVTMHQKSVNGQKIFLEKLPADLRFFIQTDRYFKLFLIFNCQSMGYCVYTSLCPEQVYEENSHGYDFDIFDRKL